MTHLLDGKATGYSNVTVNGRKTVVQDHSLGHDFGGIENQPPHHNVRPFENTDTGKVQGMEKHYYFNKRNRK